MEALLETTILTLKALADETRINIIDMLSCGDLCVCDVMEGLELTQPTVSHHLKVLERAGLVGFRKDGKWRIYYLHKAKFGEICAYIEAISSNKDDCICLNVNTKCTD